ncbi:DUF1707 domain-containing protein [Allokutzneria sp. A3M-2-11 16]|uniref:DUF1707 SHOCT-like domain-containing protein n=1 Tax=Allokutzneria sp. A3M-2-11 16 TaxID=2962043 RepID=UPI0020B6CD5B|nr:DUF1707 domain-containing protein [Allokutzneria sp. A3M-2-11 16]MCP3799462.1 DUF1707 domain-containing protein [Allokutzneria sp. A3M-2-11 16]
MSDRDLRVSDAEREHVLGLLQRAVGQGRLSLSDFSERSTRAASAVVRAELNSVLMDIPGMVLDTAAAKGSLELRHTGSTMQRTGRWVVPRTVVLRGNLGTSRLDFTEAVIAEPLVTVEMDSTAGSTTLVLPRGATVNTDELVPVMSTVTDKVGPGDHRGVPHFVLTGTLRMGSLNILPPPKKKRGLRRFFS